MAMMICSMKTGINLYELNGIPNRECTQNVTAVLLTTPMTHCLCGFAGLLHWFTGPYVHRLSYNHNTQTLDIETVSLFARPTHDSLHLSELQSPNTMRPQVTFEVSCC